MMAAAGHHLQEGRLYKAFRLLEQVRAGLPAATAPADKGAALCAPPWAQHGPDREACCAAALHRVPLKTL